MFRLALRRLFIAFLSGTCCSCSYGTLYSVQVHCPTESHNLYERGGIQNQRWSLKEHEVNRFVRGGVGKVVHCPILRYNLIHSDIYNSHCLVATFMHIHSVHIVAVCTR